VQVLPDVHNNTFHGIVRSDNSLITCQALNLKKITLICQVSGSAWLVRLYPKHRTKKVNKITIFTLYLIHKATYLIIMYNLASSRHRLCGTPASATIQWTGTTPSSPSARPSPSPRPCHPSACLHSPHPSTKTSKCA